jgi:hypothetical protein
LMRFACDDDLLRFLDSEKANKSLAKMQRLQKPNRHNTCFSRVRRGTVVLFVRTVHRKRTVIQPDHIGASIQSKHSVPSIQIQRQRSVDSGQAQHEFGRFSFRRRRRSSCPKQ